MGDAHPLTEHALPVSLEYTNLPQCLTCHRHDGRSNLNLLRSIKRYSHHNSITDNEVDMKLYLMNECLKFPMLCLQLDPILPSGGEMLAIRRIRF